jgi:hypothetical protein
MRLLRWESWCASIAFLITLIFIVIPGPYEMAMFTFIAQPLFAFAAVSYLLKVLRDLRNRSLV